MPLLFSSYLALALSAFTSATLLPGTSEAAFIAFIYHYPSHSIGALLCAGLFNGLGSIVSYGIGRLLPDKKPSKKVLSYFERYGIALLLFSWLPIIGDALPIAAGWLRLNRIKCSIILIVGKILRYSLILISIKTWI